jgi:DNA-binding response OmpR family regulator
MANILIVEDYEDLLDFLSILIRQHKFDVRGVKNIKELKECLTEFVPDIILLDVLLSTSNGRDICREIKLTNKNAVIILMSANPKLLVDYEECGADAVIEKPFVLKEVLKMINSFLPEKTNLTI